MSTFARIVNGCAVDCRVQASAADLAACFHPDWLAKNPFVIVPDGTLHGAIDNGNGTFTNPPPVDTSPKPNNPNNPYFGKRPLPRKDFFSLVGQALPADRYKRLMSDSHFLWVKDVLDGVDLVDADDRAGQFLQIIAYLTVTMGDDVKVLMTANELTTIMTAWK